MYESPYWIGWAAGSWGVSWGYDSGGEPIPVEESLAPAGHWKHLFRPIKAVNTPEVKGSCTVRCKVEPPATTRIVRIAADTPNVNTKCTIRGTVSQPFTGVTTKSVVVKTRTYGSVKVPMCGSVSQFVRGYGWAVTGKVSVPQCGVTTPAVSSRGFGYGYRELPKTIQNPTMEILALLL